MGVMLSVFLPLALAFSLPAEMAVGLMILSFCPGGVTSNILSKFARADVALSLTLTGATSLLSIVTVPLLVSWSVEFFMGETATKINVTGLAFSLFLLTTVPVVTGVAVRHYAGGFATRAEPFFTRAATVLFVIVVAGALASNWSTFIKGLPKLGPAVVALNLFLLGLGATIATLLRLGWQQVKTIAVETDIQGAAVGITVGSLIAGPGVTGLSVFSLPSAVYGIMMYVVTLPVILYARHR